MAPQSIPPAFLSPTPLKVLRHYIPLRSIHATTTKATASYRQARISTMQQNPDIKRMAPVPGKPINQIVIHDGLVYLSGQVDKTTDGTPFAETAGILCNIDARLKEAGTDKTRILSANVWMTDISRQAEMNRAWNDWLAPEHMPARATVQAALGEGFDIEIKVIAALPSQRRIIDTKEAAAAVGPYNQAVVADGTVYVSGCIGALPGGRGMVQGGVVEETKQAFKNVAAILKEAGATVGDVVKTTVLLDDMADFAKVNAIYEQFFEGVEVPARSCFAAKQLPKGALVEIEVIAVISQT